MLLLRDRFLYRSRCPPRCGTLPGPVAPVAPVDGGSLRIGLPWTLSMLWVRLSVAGLPHTLSVPAAEHLSGPGIPKTQSRRLPLAPSR